MLKMLAWQPHQDFLEDDRRNKQVHATTCLKLYVMFEHHEHHEHQLNTRQKKHHVQLVHLTFSEITENPAMSWMSRECGQVHRQGRFVDYIMCVYKRVCVCVCVHARVCVCVCHNRVSVNMARVIFERDMCSEVSPQPLLWSALEGFQTWSHYLLEEVICKDALNSSLQLISLSPLP